MKRLYIKLFGGLRLYTWDGSCYVVRSMSPRLRPLIACLIMQKGDSIERLALAEKFYPQNQEEQSAATKRTWLRQGIRIQLLAALNIENEEPTFVVEKNWFCLDDERYTTDARLLRDGALKCQILPIEELENLVSYYDGEYLAGYEEWISEDGVIPPGHEKDLEAIQKDRANYRADYLTLLGRLLESYIAECGKFVAARKELLCRKPISEAQRGEAERLRAEAEKRLNGAVIAANRALLVRREEPAQVARPHHVLMRVYAMQRRPDKVEAQYEYYEQECRRVGIAPEATMRERRDELMRGMRPPPPPPPPSSDPNRLIADLLTAQGCAHWSERTYATLKKSIGIFERALEHWPDHADAKAGIADAYSLMYYYSFMEPHQAICKAREYLDAVPEKDAEAPPVLTARAWIATIYDRDWLLAKELFEKSKNKDPGNATTLQWLSFLLMLQGNFNDSLVEIRAAYRENDAEKQSSIISKSFGQRYHYMGRYDDAVKSYLESLREERYPRKCLTLYCLALSYEQQALAATEATEKAEKGRLAIQAFNKALRDHHLINYPSIVAGLGHAYAQFGEPEEAEDILEQLKQRRKDGEYVSPVALATVYLGLEGEKNRQEALNQLEEAVSQKPGDLVLVNIDPRFNVLRSDSRFRNVFAENAGAKTMGPDA